MTRSRGFGCPPTARDDASVVEEHEGDLTDPATPAEVAPTSPADEVQMPVDMAETHAEDAEVSDETAQAHVDDGEISDEMAAASADEGDISDEMEATSVEEAEMPVETVERVATGHDEID